MTEPREIKERTFDFATRIVRLCRALEEMSGAPRTLANQLLRSGTSIGANVEEAHGSHSKPDFIAKMSIATKEARETNYWLRLIAATEMVPPSELAEITDESTVESAGCAVEACSPRLKPRSPRSQPQAPRLPPSLPRL